MALVNRPLFFEYNPVNKDIDKVRLHYAQYSPDVKSIYEKNAFNVEETEEQMKIYRYLAREHGASVQQVKSLVVLSYFKETWESQGRQTFLVKKNLMDMLAKTDPKVGSEYFRMPYDCFCIQFQNTFTNTGIGEIYMNVRMVDEQRLLNFCIIDHVEADGTAGGYTDFYYMLNDGTTIFDDMQRIQDELVSQLAQGINYGDDLLETIKLAINVVLYINSGVETEIVKLSPDSEFYELRKKARVAKNAGKKRKYQSRLTKYTSVIKYVLGELFEHVDFNVTPHWVRGYFKQYKHERYREEIRFKPFWIRPFFKRCKKEEGQIEEQVETTVVESDEPRVYVVG